MAIRSGRFNGRNLGLFVLSIFLGCASAPRVFLQYGAEFKQEEFEKVLAENPLASSENIKITTLGQGQSGAITSCKSAIGKSPTCTRFTMAPW